MTDMYYLGLGKKVRLYDVIDIVHQDMITLILLYAWERVKE